MTLVIINPASAGGRTRSAWPAISRALKAAVGRFDTAWTNGPGDGLVLARGAVEAGRRRIIAVGGDGTVNEAINGLCVTERGPPADVVFSVVPSGTGSDFQRTFGAFDAEPSIARLKAPQIRRIDLGRLAFQDHAGRPSVRWFCNVASFGLSGAVDMAINKARFSKLLGGKFAFFWNTYLTMRRYGGSEVEIAIDNHEPLRETISTVAVANGRFFGGGMMIAPQADPADGLLDVIVIRQSPPIRLSDMKLVYTGAHLGHPRVAALRGKRIVAHPVSTEPVLLDVDGEAPGCLPATFDIVPKALSLQC
jgi:YegS/Rv2252/BmrU family lipid kinase